MELREALDHVAEIRHRLAEAELYRGYRALPAAFAGVLAFAAGCAQHLFVEPGLDAGPAYVLYWGCVAALCLGASAAVMWLRDRMARSHGIALVTRTGLTPLIPCLVAGASLSMVLIRLEPESSWMLPGLWQLFYSQGLFASSRTLPRGVFVVPSFFLVAGIGTLCFARGPHALSPFAMAVPFGIGQLLAAGTLYWTSERHDQPQENAES